MKRALIITYYWPPAGGPGVQRWLQFVKYLGDFGITPVVYVPENPHYPMIDTSFLSEVPSDIEIIKHPIREPYALAGLLSKKKTKQISSGIITNKQISFLERLMLYIRGNFFIPDARVGWVKPSIKFLSHYIAKNSVDVVITSGPPHSLHLIGMELKKELGLKWIADFRDPWTSIHYFKSLRLSSSSLKKHKALESKVLNESDSVVVTSPTTKTEFEKLCTTPIEVITNGYVVSEGVIPVLDKDFTIAHVGSLLSERNPQVLWKIFSEIASENIDFKKDLKIKLAGVVSATVIESISDFGLEDNCDLMGYVDHFEALQIQYNAQLLLLLEIDREETRSIIPGKLFEYLAARRPILGIGPLGSDIQTIINETKSGMYFNPSQYEELKAGILQCYSNYKNGTLASTSQGIEKYSRRELTRKMADIIKNI
jgi:glycosyltransferase involved in cell wall biosynthesis